MYLDTNVIYHFLFETELTERAERIVRLGIVTGMAMPMIVYNESPYVVGAKIARSEYGVKGKYSFRAVFFVLSLLSYLWALQSVISSSP